MGNKEKGNNMKIEELTNNERHKDEFTRWCLEMKRDYHIYFVTYAFHHYNQVIRENAHHWFNRHVQRINNAVVSNKNQYAESCVLMVYQEEDYNGRVHYHGLLLVHKNRYDRFMNKVVEKTEEFQTKSKRKKDAINTYDRYVIADKYLKPFHQYTGKAKKKEGKFDFKMKPNQTIAPVLSLKDLVLLPTYLDEQIKKVYWYSQKKSYAFDADPNKFMIFKAEEPDKKSKKKRRQKIQKQQRHTASLPEHKYKHDRKNKQENCVGEVTS